VTGDPAVLVEGIAKSFGSVEALRGIDFTVAPGTVLGMLGPNGAGKTTAVRILTTLLRPSAGHASVLGHDVVREAAAVREVIGLAGQATALVDELTGRENLEMIGRLHHLHKADARARARELLTQFDLDDAADRAAKTYSGGMRRRLDLAGSLVARPRVMFLDEPTTGLDPHARVAVWELIHGLRAEGLAVVLTTHYMDEAERLSDRLQVLQAGRVRAMGMPRAVLGDVVGEHVVLLGAQSSQASQVIEWFRNHGAKPAQVLSHWHIPLDAPGLAAFVAAFPDLEYEVRPPTLDDLFLALAHETMR